MHEQTFLKRTAVSLLAGCLLASCVTTDRQVSPSSSRRSPVPRDRTDSTPPPALNLNPAGDTFTLDLRAVIGLLGAVPYDNFTLPVVSPDGRSLATQAGIAPTWSTILARPDAAVPEATRVEIHQLDLRTGIPEDQRTGAQHVATVGEPVMLGRSSSPEGFLVESPRSDGSRWIGIAAWTTGEIHWLVDDDQVNAFASLGSDGRLAWCRRAPDESTFELVIRHGEQEWSWRTDDQDWLFPLWSGREDGLFVLSLFQGDLFISRVIATNEATFRQSINTLRLSSQATRRHAYQTFAGNVTTAGLPVPRVEQIGFVHPAYSRAAVWRPLSYGATGPAILYRDSFAVLPDDSDIAFVSTPDNLKRQSLIDPKIHANILAGSIIPRRIASPDWHFILLAPGEGTIGLTTTRLLPPER